jgi:hypothetical protein
MTVTTTTTAAPPPAPTDTTIVATIQKDWSWLISHLILLAVVGLLVTGAVYGTESLIAKHDAARSTQFAQILATQAAETKTLQQQFAADELASAVRDAQYQQTIAQLSKSIQVRDANAQKQQQTDATLDAVSAASRLATQTGAKPGEVTVAEDNVILDLPITRNIVASLDSLATIEADLQDTKNELTAQTGLTADANTKLADADKVIASQTTQLADSTKACQAQISAVKAEARKSKFHWFIGGYIAGFVSAKILKIGV